MIEATGLTKRYRQRVAVDDVSFKVEPGKVTGFLGPNGAGKSTTMRLMLGLDYGDGSTLFEGKPLSSYNQPSQMVGILLEAKAFHPTRTAERHLSVLAAAGGIDQQRVAEVLQIVGLDEVANRAPGKFSLGMAQRLGIAAAILGNPKYLILDEPANGLDPEGIAWLRSFIKQYAAAGNAVFVSSHLLSEMAQMADNVIVIGRGKLIRDTSMSALLADNGHSSIFVRTDRIEKLEKVLRKKLMSFKRHNGGLTIEAVKTDDIGKMAFDAGLPILELSPHVVSLEEAFLEITSDSQEYHSSQTEKKAKEA